MVLLESKILDKNFSCPDFSLPSVDDQKYSLKDFSQSKALLVMFICNHCPYVKAVENRIVNLRKLFSLDDLAMVGICSNDAESYPDDNKENLFKVWQKKNYGFPYLIDADQSVAKSFDAVCTPEFYLFDQKRKLFYRGRLDDNWQNENKVTTHDLQDAIECILKLKPAPAEQRPSMGCSIKWIS